MEAVCSKPAEHRVEPLRPALPGALVSVPDVEVSGHEHLVGAPLVEEDGKIGDRTMERGVGEELAGLRDLVPDPVQADHSDGVTFRRRHIGGSELAGVRGDKFSPVDLRFAQRDCPPWRQGDPGGDRNERSASTWRCDHACGFRFMFHEATVSM